MSVSLPRIVADLGGLNLLAWVVAACTPSYARTRAIVFVCRFADKFRDASLVWKIQRCLWTKVFILVFPFIRFKSALSLAGA